eukprot:scaffold172735_cov35-Tisochrysis_lutea.AAC.3
MPAIHPPALEDMPASPAIPNSTVPSAASLPSLVVPSVPPVTSSPSTGGGAKPPQLGRNRAAVWDEGGVPDPAWTSPECSDAS